MSESSSESSRTSESVLQSPKNSPVSITSVRKRPGFKNKQEEGEETISTEEENPTPIEDEEKNPTPVEDEKENPTPITDKKENPTPSKHKGVNFAFLGIQETLNNSSKLFVLLVIISLSIPIAVYWLVRPVGVGNSVSSHEEKRMVPVEFSSKQMAELESLVQKLRDQVEAFEEAGKHMQEKLDILEGVVGKLDSENSATRAELNNLELEVSALNRSLMGLEISPNDIIGCINETALLKKLAEFSNFTKMTIEEEIENHEADGIGKVDYALASGGAVVLSHSEPEFPISENKHSVHPDAIKMLNPSFGEPGQCFSLKGHSGFVEIRLRTEIVPESMTLEHVSHRVAYNLSSAPKDCNVTGWLSVPRTGQNRTGQNGTIGVHKLVAFRYDLQRKKNVQTFKVEKRTGNCSSEDDEIVVNVVRFEFRSNYGANSTCIYRFRIHGRESEGKFGNGRNRRSSGMAKSVDWSVMMLCMFVVLVMVAGFL